MIAYGKECYHEKNGAIHGYGRKWSEDDLSSALYNEVASLVYDDAGNEHIQSILEKVVTTDFDKTELEKVLAISDSIKDWQVGEAIAECYLTQHCNCLFPWPDGRDVRRPKSSLPGADLVGYISKQGETRFVFGEVKTSAEAKWPPQVCRGKKDCLVNQVKDLCLEENIKNQIFIYLGSRAGTLDKQFMDAAKHYINDKTNVHIIGFLVRDVEPNADDLKKPLQDISGICPSKTKTEFLALYLPNDKINTLAKTVVNARNGGVS